MIPFSHRFHGHNSLRYVYKNGRVERTRLATIKSVKNTHRDQSRFAVVVTKKIMKSAVRRNRIRRRVYEYIRLATAKLQQNYDVVIIISSSDFLTMTPAELASQLDQLFSQSDLYKTPVK